MKRLIALALLVFAALPAGIAIAQATWTYELPLSVVTGEYAILVNRDHRLTSTDEPNHLAAVDVRKTSGVTMEMDATAAAALEAMFADAAKVTEYVYRDKNANGDWEYAAFSDSGGLQLILDNGYRSYSRQSTIYNNYLSRNNGVDDGISSPPGASEHQTGLACDVLSVDYESTHQYMNATFYETPEAQWMEEFAFTYGFLIRYPADKETITQVPYEPWHLRYVGREIAAYIKRTGLTLEEFTDEWQAALDRFLADGGDVQSQLLLESTMTPTTVTTTILDVCDGEGDPEVSLSR